MQKGVSHRNVACVFCLERKWGRMAQVFHVEQNKNNFYSYQVFK